MKNTNSPAAKTTSQSSGSLSDSLSSAFAAIVIPLSLLVSFLIYNFILGDPSHFIGDNPENNPKPGDYLGIVHKGGYVVPVLMSLFIMVVVFTLERFFTIGKAKGKGSVGKFVHRVRSLISRGEIDSAIVEADKQKGSVANVVKAGLQKYKEMENNYSLDPEKKVLAIQKDIEEATQLEMPMLEKNLVVIATIASIATLLGLFGTVLGMINAFAALAQAGAPDAVKLANGISEALINTALGIGTSALAIIFYNYFTSKIDELTYGIDETGFTITQSFASKANKSAAV